MKLYYIGILKNESQPGQELSAHELCVQKDLNSFPRFGRSSYGEYMTMFSKVVAERTKPGQRQDVEEQTYVFHAYGHSQGIAGIIISDNNYPSLAAHQLLSKVVDEFLTMHPRSSWANSNPTLSFPKLKDYIAEYQDATKVSTIADIQKKLDDTREIMIQTIDSLTRRGENIDKLVEKSQDLSAQSKMFYTQAKKQNSCCVVM